MQLLDLFAGIGGFSLAAHWMGWQTAAFVERDKFCQRVLRKNFGEGIEIHDDVKSFDGTPFRGEIDIVSGGFPCQDLSIAGRERGIEAGKRSSLWRELHRIIGEVRPRYAIVENVANLIAGDRGQWFGRLLGDLAEIGFDAEWRCIPSSHVGAPHIRDRVWILAHPTSERWVPILGETYDRVDRELLQAPLESGHHRWSKTGRHSMERVGWSVEPDIRGSDDDVPDRMDRLKALGNTINPLIPLRIFKAIEAADAE